MKVKCIEAKWMFDNSGNLYFMDAEGNMYYWYTRSYKAAEEIYDDTVIEITSYKDGGKWHMDGVEYNTITNVRFKVLDEELITAN